MATENGEPIDRAGGLLSAVRLAVHGPCFACLARPRSPSASRTISGAVQTICRMACTVDSGLVLADILIIAPYNAQVFELQRRLPDARVGTVDKFQGQEAPLVIFSMTTSSHADAPRGMEFLYSLNRLNVATSRAKCICVLVASPSVFEADCRTPDQMRMANAYCRYLELAQRI
jgi:superfamily I DNA and/or RNA helicase